MSWQKSRPKRLIASFRPDQGSQSSMSPQDAAKLWWSTFDGYKNEGYRLWSPAVTNAQSGEKWMDDFLGACGCADDVCQLCRWLPSHALITVPSDRCHGRTLLRHRPSTPYLLRATLAQQVRQARGPHRVRLPELRWRSSGQHGPSLGLLQDRHAVPHVPRLDGGCLPLRYVR